MTVKVGCNMLKKYSIISMIDENGEIGEANRVEHDGDQLDSFLKDLPDGSEVAVEA